MCSPPVLDRIAGATSEVTALKDGLNRGRVILLGVIFILSVSCTGIWPITPSSDIYAVCDLIKTWFRVLPEPAFPSYSYHDVIKAMRKAILTVPMTRRLTVFLFHRNRGLQQPNRANTYSNSGLTST
jgi:RhoGAP (GTPase activating protein)-like protein